MDLVARVRRVVAVMEHVAKGTDGSIDPKLLKACALPLTGKGAVDTIITEFGGFTIAKKTEGTALVEMAPGMTVEEFAAKTGASFRIALSKMDSHDH